MAQVIGTVVLALVLSGCASAGGTAGIFDLSSVWYKHPRTGEVKECGGGFYPGVQIRRYSCGKTLLDRGYVEVEKCKHVAAGALCVTEAEMRGGPVGATWVLWSPVLDSDGKPMANQWSPVRAYDSRWDCEAEQRRASTVSLLCLPDTVDPRGPKGGGR